MHSIASCNAAEIAMGMLMEATVPTSHRWIPKAMTVQYLEKATTSLRAGAALQPPDFASITEGVEMTIPVSVTDTAGPRRHHLLGDARALTSKLLTDRDPRTNCDLPAVSTREGAGNQSPCSRYVP